MSFCLKDTNNIRHIIIYITLEEKLKNIEDNQYDLLWLIYFVKSLDLSTISFTEKINSELIKSLKSNRAEFFKPIPTDIKLFDTIKRPEKNILLLKHLSLFKSETEE